MFYVTVNNKEYHVSFKHITQDYDFGNDLETRRVTYCAVSFEDVVVFKGFAICNPKDNFSYNKGRKQALREAIKYLPKASRILFWNAYQQQRGYLGETRPK